MVPSVKQSRAFHSKADVSQLGCVTEVLTPFLSRLYQKILFPEILVLGNGADKRITVCTCYNRNQEYMIH